ncbi:MAG TPA: ectonucleotide pyrophosphatase/phosphodiesterase [Pyrinomonadaceae bacterium]|nr:ectonucleotide pyrophosphatase/phosphodiesterase [Pyrinomonadaceae bacterium]
MKKLIFTGFLCLGVFLPVFAQKTIKDLKSTVILIALDGFRYDYPEKFRPPTLNKLARNGVRAKWLIPSFPTKTFPNHYTVATGLYPENHGIVENNIYDFGTVFTMSRREEVQNSRWWLGEPIWVTAAKQGQRSGAFFFPGTEAEIQGVRPNFWKAYDGKIPNEARVDAILSWLDLPLNERPTVFTLYFSDVDEAGHDFSPESEETRRAVLRVDENLARLTAGLKARGISEKVNTIIFSDHGMATADQRNSIVLDEYFDLNKTERILWAGEFVQIFPKTGAENEIVDALQSRIRHAECWRKSEIPARFHYRASPRIAPIVCLAQEGWMMTSREKFEITRKRADFGKPKGEHGYDNRLASMRAIFVAHGEAFKKGIVTEPFENVDVYNIMAQILDLTPARNDGSPETARKVLRKKIR